MNRFVGKDTVEAVFFHCLAQGIFGEVENVCILKHEQKVDLKNYQNDKAWWHDKFKNEKRQVTEKMHMLRLEYLTVNGIDCKETRNTPPVVAKRSMKYETTK